MSLLIDIERSYRNPVGNTKKMTDLNFCSEIVWWIKIVTRMNWLAALLVIQQLP